METIKLDGTPLATTILGLGCAGLFRLSNPAERRAVLEASYDAGIRHFDVAPMYGLGLAEAELAPILRRRRDAVTVMTKFGIDPTPIGREIARVQRPMRATLAKLPRLGNEMKVSGQGPRAGRLGRLLYKSAGYDAKAAERALDRSLRTLRTDYIDMFALHDPVGDLSAGNPGLISYLERQRQAGKIRAWGLAGDGVQTDALLHDLVGVANFLQFRDDMFAPPPTKSAPTPFTLTFGALGTALGQLQRLLQSSPEQCTRWSERFSIDLSDTREVPRFLLREAIRRNPKGPVLFTTTHIHRVHAAVEAAAGPSNDDPGHDVAMADLAAAIRDAGPSVARDD